MSARTSLAIAIAAVAAASPALADSVGPWSGPYVGVSGGYGWGDQGQHDGFLLLPSGGTSGTSTTTITTTCFTDCIGDGHYGLGGGLIGGTVGYNWQMDRFVYGLEGDGSWADITGSGACGADQHACGGSIEGLGTVRGRLGFDAGPVVAPFGPTFFYVTGGLAVGDVHAWDSLYGGSGRSVLAGWTVGAGVEVMFAKNWSAKLEYLHVDLGDHNIFSMVSAVPEYVRTTANIVRLGLNYHFDLAPPSQPLVSKY